jgi:hypothetical protein
MHGTGTTNALFVAVFNCLGVLPALYAALLLPGAGGGKDTGAQVD